MGQVHWHARIDVDGEPSGAGFLVDPCVVVTCAHVIGEVDRMVVHFPTTGQSALVREISFCGPGGLDEDSVGAGDFAVLTLTEPMSIKPAVFAPFNTALSHPTEQYHLFGYPNKFDKGTSAIVEVQASPLIDGEVCQLNGTAKGSALAKGFSGGAVYRNSGNNEVVGMITSASSGGERRIGSMLPTEVLCRHWPPLAELIGLGPLSPTAYSELRDLLGDLEVDRPDRILAQVAYERSPFRGRTVSCPNVLAVAEVLVDLGHSNEDTINLINSLLMVLRRHPAAAHRGEAIFRWIQRHTSLDRGSVEILAAEVDPVEAQAFVVVRIDITDEGPDERPDWPRLTVWPVSGSDNHFGEPYEQTFPMQDLRREVEIGIRAAINRIPDSYASIAVEFVVHEGMLNIPFETWTDLEDHEPDIPLGWTRPVVLRDIDSFEGRSGEMHQRSRLLAAKRLESSLRWKDCAKQSDTLTMFRAWLRGSMRPLAVGLTGVWSEQKWVASAISGGVPMVIWPRVSCREHPVSQESGRCLGDQFRKAINDAVAGIQADELPERVRRLRADAASIDSEDFQCGREVVLFFDNADRRNHATLGFAR